MNFELERCMLPGRRLRDWNPSPRIDTDALTNQTARRIMAKAENDHWNGQ
ncbi:hypothetical protein ACQ858_14925 [Variovorax ureilyticus]